MVAKITQNPEKSCFFSTSIFIEFRTSFFTDFGPKMDPKWFHFYGARASFLGTFLRFVPKLGPGRVRDPILMVLGCILRPFWNDLGAILLYFWIFSYFPICYFLNFSVSYFLNFVRSSFLTFSYFHNLVWSSFLTFLIS